VGLALTCASLCRTERSSTSLRSPPLVAGAEQSALMACVRPPVQGDRGGMTSSGDRAKGPPRVRGPWHEAVEESTFVHASVLLGRLGHPTRPSGTTWWVVGPSNFTNWSDQKAASSSDDLDFPRGMRWRSSPLVLEVEVLKFENISGQGRASGPRPWSGTQKTLHVRGQRDAILGDIVEVDRVCAEPGTWVRVVGLAVGCDEVNHRRWYGPRNPLIRECVAVSDSDNLHMTWCCHGRRSRNNCKRGHG
jgi:hypothetical protein